MRTCELAQLNVARLVAPIDDPRIANFVSQLASINALAESSPGFIWRLQSDGGNATDLPFNDDPLMIANLSVWESVEALQAFTYSSRHVEVLRERRSWFEKPELPHFVMWWVPSGHRPTLSEARERLELLRAYGPGPEAFVFSKCFPPPLNADAAAPGAR